MTYLKNLPAPFYILAPMDDVTDTVFRQVVNNLSPADMYFTEFVNVDGLNSPGRTKLLKKLKFSKDENRLIAQLWGKDPHNFYLIAQQIADGTISKELGLPAGHNFIGVDLNMGCPQKNEVKTGTCAALMNNRPLAKEIIEATKKGLNNKLPLSVKTRIGFSEIDLTWIEFLLTQNLDMLSVHARTKKEKSSVPAHWHIFEDIVRLRDKISPETLIVGNGDIKNRVHGLELAKKIKLDGIMIGRGIFDDPYAFSTKSPWETMSKNDKLNLYKKHILLFKKTWQPGQRNVHVLNRFCKMYVSGFTGSKEMREKLMKGNSTTELLKLINQLLEASVVTCIAT